MRRDVSVIIPVYNRFEVLPHVVESILAQTCPVAEIILVDDGSTWSQPDLIPRYIAERPAWRERVRYFYQENQGVPGAMNAGIARAKGYWLAFNGHDDLWLPWKLEWQLRALETYEDTCGLCFTDGWFMNNPYMKTSLFQFNGRQDGPPLGMIDDPVRLMANRHPLWTQTILARADLVRQIGGADPEMRYSEDHDFLFRLALVTKFCYVSMPMVLIDRSPAEKRHVGEAENWHREEFRLRMDQRRFEKQLQLCTEQPADIQRAIRRNLRSIQSAWATWYIANHDYAKARTAISNAARYDLTLPVAVKWFLTHLSPALTARLLSIRDRKAAPRHDRISWAEKPGDAS